MVDACYVVCSSDCIDRASVRNPGRSSELVQGTQPRIRALSSLFTQLGCLLADHLYHRQRSSNNFRVSNRQFDLLRLRQVEGIVVSGLKRLG